MGVGKLASVFLFKFKASSDISDEFVWVVTGDIPNFYIDIKECPNAACALDSYIGIMSEWADAAINSNSFENLPDIGVAPSEALGTDLKKRLKYIDENILSNYQDLLVD